MNEAAPATIRPLNRRALVISPWLPTRSRPFAGTFVVDFITSIKPIYSYKPVVVRVDDAFRSNRPRAAQYAAKGLVNQRAKSMGLAGDAGIDVPLPVKPGAGWLERMEAARRIGGALRPLVRGSRIAGSPWPDIHGHVGIIAGPLASRFHKGCRLFLYEHSSFALDLLESDRRARHIYAEAVTRSTNVLAVNSDLMRRLQDLFPESAHKFKVHPNTVDANRFQFVDRNGPLRKLIYIGSLKPAKGTRRLVEALEAIVTHYPDVTLTLVGDGPDREWLMNHPLRSHLDLRPSIPAAAVPGLLAEHDLLLHLSEAETFGLTAAEAILSGMPVLVSSTDGSEMLVRPIESVAGRIVDQPAQPQAVLAAFQHLQGNQTTLDPQEARRHIVRNYDRPVVATRLASLIQGDPGQPE